MDTDRKAVQTWFFERLTEHLAEVFEAMSGTRPDIKCGEAAAGAAPEGPRWRQVFKGFSGQSASGTAWIHASERDWKDASNQILRAAGIEDADQETLQSTWTETLGQAWGAIARDFSGRMGREITCAAGGESTEPAPPQWTRLGIEFAGNTVIEISATLDEALLESLTLPAQKAVAAAASASETSGSAAAASGSTIPPSKTFDLLLDVELPVSVSFGRAQIPLKDVIKLTTGAIVELNRSITEPVEVIVNNCVIARGEVVVVEGNFGVKIREVISRHDRLRTLN